MNVKGLNKNNNQVLFTNIKGPYKKITHDQEKSRSRKKSYSIRL